MASIRISVHVTLSKNVCSTTSIIILEGMANNDPKSLQKGNKYNTYICGIHCTKIIGHPVITANSKHLSAEAYNSCPDLTLYPWFTLDIPLA